MGIILSLQYEMCITIVMSTRGKHKNPGSDDFDAQHCKEIALHEHRRVRQPQQFFSARKPPNAADAAIEECSPGSGQLLNSYWPIGSGSEKKQTQSSELLEEFEGIFDELGELMLEFESDSTIGTACSCSKEQATTQCHDCTGYSATCSNCFIEKHLQSPFHWAEVWDFAKQFFVRHDISTLSDAIQLGYNGKSCTQPSNPRLFTIVDGNGVHATRIAFCGCKTQPLLPIHKVRQLMRSHLFPATSTDAATAFTFGILKESSLHNLESKKVAYDYLGTLLCLTDNSFMADVPNPSANFLCVVRVWNHLMLKKRAGQMHYINGLLPHRPPGNLLEWCPGCPEAGFNSDPHLRHCNQSQRTLDGNFQCNQFNKNTDPDDVSLAAGNGYFPPDDKYKEYLAKIPVSHDKSTCNYLKVVNKQDKKIFKNMAITGMVNCQCSHVFLQYGERFSNTDAALACEMRQRKPGESFDFILRIEVEDINQVTMYDIACEYYINLESHFQQHFPDLVEDVRRMRWHVLSLHVQGHQDSYNYLFGTTYMECVGHFHGETAEHYWPEVNQLGPHVRQMNNGHRQDTIISHHGDWNHKRTMKITVTLANDLALANTRYVEKRNHFIGLLISYSDRLDMWKQMDRTQSKVGKEAKSVYKHRTSKVPSQTAIYQAMLVQDDNFQSTLVLKNKVARFLNDTLKIQDSQRQLQVAIQEASNHKLESNLREVQSRRTKLNDMIIAWRQQQKSLAPKLGDKVSAQAAASPAVQIEHEKLFIPSDLTASERLKLDLVNLGVEEVRWWEGQAFDALWAVQNVVKAVTALYNRKEKNKRQQKDNTEGLGTSFPPLKEANTFMKSVRKTCQVDDSRFTDGLLWWVMAGSSTPPDGLPTTHVRGTTSAMSGTQMDTCRSAPHGRSIKTLMPEEQQDLNSQRPEGWLWQLGKIGRLSQSEMEEWSNEGDRVQCFRAEAEMQRWQEQKEQKLVELLWTIRSFVKMHQDMQLTLGKKAWMYERQAEAAWKLIRLGGYQALLSPTANVIEFIEGERMKEEQLTPVLRYKSDTKAFLVASGWMQLIHRHGLDCVSLAQLVKFWIGLPLFCSHKVPGVAHQFERV
ncbi:hypothetical protein B0H10DRAFT_2195843 [Mycena sp. CBHHK59/15]|nr:hypothetical protein B0H10DRAFT_2195843 [Mycena sp. CBHHK59/15]